MNASKISVVLQYHKSFLYNVGKMDPCSNLNLSNKCVRNQTRRKDKKEQQKTKQKSDKEQEWYKKRNQGTKIKKKKIVWMKEMKKFVS
jgi:hypothetical protein